MATKQRSGRTSPVIVLLSIVLLATGLTWLIPSGQYQRENGLVVPGSFEVIDKQRELRSLIVPSNDAAETARPAGFTDAFLAIPKGMQRLAGLIFMVLIIGGLFGVLEASGAVAASIDRLLTSLHGNIYLLVVLMMTVFALGSTFLGLASEYLIVIPLVVSMANRIGLSNIIGLAIVTVAVKVGYLASVTNPLPLSIAQPLVGVPVFSGAGVRFGFFLVYLVFGVGFVLLAIRRAGFDVSNVAASESHRLSVRHTAVLIGLLAGVSGLVAGSTLWEWNHIELSAYYLFLTVVIAGIGGLAPSAAADGFIAGMKKILMASMLIGVAAAVAIILEDGYVLDTVVHGLTTLVGESYPTVAATGMFVSQLLLDFMIPSTSGQAAVSMPILAPLGQVTGVSPQTTVLAFLFGNGITNMLTPTSGTLLAYLASANVPWSQWARFIAPLWALFIVIALVLLAVAVGIGY